MKSRVPSVGGAPGDFASRGPDDMLPKTSRKTIGDPHAVAGHGMKPFAGKSAKVGGRLVKTRLLRPTKLGGGMK